MELKIDGYNVSRSLSNAKDRGVIIYVQETLSYEECSALNKHNFKESMWIILKLQNSYSILLDASSGLANNVRLNEILSVAEEINNKYKVIKLGHRLGGLVHNS